MPFTFSSHAVPTPEQANPLMAALSGLFSGYGKVQGFQKDREAIQKAVYENMFEKEKSQYYPRTAKAETELAEARPAYMGAQTGLAGAETDKIRYLLQHPGFMGGEDAKTITALQEIGVLPKDLKSQNVSYQNMPSQGQESETNLSQPFKTGNPLVDAILNRKHIQAAYEQKGIEGYTWNHLPVSAQNQYVAQGLGMGIDPRQMMKYVNQNLDMKEIAKKEELDPNNIPPPYYPPTQGTLTRTQQVEQVSAELDYVTSAVTPLISQYADTYGGFSPKKIEDMLSDDPAAQKRFGEYIGALSLQTGLSTGRSLMEGTTRPGVEIMKAVRDSSLKGIDTHSPIKMSKTAFEAAQNKINEVLKKGAKIRTTTGMSPFSNVGKTQAISNELDKKKSSTSNNIPEGWVIMIDAKGNKHAVHPDDVKRAEVENKYKRITQ